MSQIELRKKLHARLQSKKEARCPSQTNYPPCFYAMLELLTVPERDNKKLAFKLKEIIPKIESTQREELRWFLSDRVNALQLMTYDQWMSKC